MVKSAQAVTVLFATSSPATGAAANADSTPTGTLYVNGTSDAASVTVTNITTGVYKAAVTLPTLNSGDIVSLRISATIGGVAGEAVAWQDVGSTTSLTDINSTVVQIGTGASTVSANVVQISGDSTAADNLEALTDGTGYAGGTIPLSVNVTQLSGDATAADNLEAALDGTGFPLGGARVSFGGNVKTQDYIEAFGVFTRAGALAAPSAVLVDVTWVKMDGGAYTANVETGATPTLVSTGIYRRQRTTGYPYTGPGMMIFRFYTSDTTVDNRESIMWFNVGVGVEDYVVDPLAVDVDAILAKVSAIGTSQIVYMSPQVGSTLITIYQGDSYYGTKTQKLRWAVPLNVADLTGATVTFKLAQSPSNFSKACSVTGAGVDGSQLVELQLTAAETAAWAAATGVKFEVEASWSGPTEVKTIDVGTATITAQLT